MLNNNGLNVGDRLNFVTCERSCEPLLGSLSDSVNEHYHTGDESRQCVLFIKAVSAGKKVMSSIFEQFKA